MPRRLFAVAILSMLALLAACGVPEIPPIPAVGIDAGGAKLMTDARTPAEAYSNAYTKLFAFHRRVRDGLLNRDAPNLEGAKSSLESIAENLRLMQALTAGPEREAIKPYITRYAQMAEDVGRGRYGATWQTDLERWEREIRSRFAPGVVTIVDAWPEGMGPREQAPKEAPPPREPASARPPQAEPGNLAYGLVFQAWRQSHADLVENFKQGKDCSTAYALVREAMAALRSRLPEERRSKLDLMLGVYEQQHRETDGFTRVPEFSSKELILRQLELVGDTVRTEYDPAKVPSTP